jgi:hypothetical protein
MNSPPTRRTLSKRSHLAEPADNQDRLPYQQEMYPQLSLALVHTASAGDFTEPRIQLSTNGKKMEEMDSAIVAMEHAVVAPHRKTARRVRNGKSTNELIFSAMQGTNDELFPQVLSLYVKPGSVIADVTYGKGVFWKKVEPGAYRVKATDLATGIDCRHLPYSDGTIDCLVFDPPYMHTPGGTAHVGHQNYEQYYRNNHATSLNKYHDAVLDLYFTMATEAWRVLKDRGVFIVKCQDEVCANQQRLTHVEIINHYERLGFCTEDLFVLIRQNRPGVSRVAQQVHARKNHSYFIVFWKRIQKQQRWAKVGIAYDVGA